MILAIRRNGTTRAIGKLPPGDDGIAATIAAIQAVVDDAAHGSTHDVFVQVAQRIARDAGASSPVEFGRELYDFLSAYMDFQRDPDRVELVRHPIDLIEQMRDEGTAYGDCDDMATLAAAIISAAGFVPVLVTVGRAKPGRFEHIFAGVRLGSNLTRENVYPIDAQEHTGAGKFPDVSRVKLWSLSPSPLG